MRAILVVVSIFLSLTSFAQVDTAQYEIPGRQNSEFAKDQPYVILISIDGFRYDYAEKFQAKNLLKLANSGVKAKAMIPSYPSNTFPNHYSIVTGMYPSTHGLIDNSFYDPHRNQTYTMGNKDMVTDSSWYGGLPIWGLAEKNDMLAASLFWVSSESNVAGLSPTYYYKYHNLFTNDRKVEIVKSWLELPADVRPHLITLYFPDVDSKGHRFGPDAPETQQAVDEVDAAIGLLVKEIEKLNLPSVNYVLVSDHGMLGVDTENPLFTPEFLNDDRFVVVNSASLVRITAKNPLDIKPLYTKLKNEKDKEYKVYLTRKFPRRLHFRNNADDRIGDIIIIPDAPKVFKAPYMKYVSKGNHGYDPKKVPEMNATFYAWGPLVKSGKKIKAFKNIHVYPFIAEMLGLKVNHDIDGKEKVLRKALR